MSTKDYPSFPNPRRVFFKKIAAAAAGTVAAGGIVPTMLKAAEKRAETRVTVKTHPEAVKRAR